MLFLSDLGFRLGRAIRGWKHRDQPTPSSPSPSPTSEKPQDRSEATFARELRQKQEDLRREQAKRQLEALVAKYTELIGQFYKITERKVSLLDDYGDENWKALPKEVDIILQKIADREGISIPQFHPILQCELKPFLTESFREYHEREQSRRIDKIEYSKMTGTDFEIYLIKMLKQYGFLEIRGTPSTGDQGADLIAKKNGKTIIIQAKRYEGPVGNKAVQEVASAVSYYGGDEGWVMTNSTYKEPLENWLRKQAFGCLMDEILNGFQIFATRLRRRAELTGDPSE
jgi:hypothetical protein